MCFVGAGACPLRPCVVPVTTAPREASSGSCPTGAKRAEPDLTQLVVSSSVTTVVMRSATGAGIAAPTGDLLSASP